MVFGKVKKGLRTIEAPVSQLLNAEVIVASYKTLFTLFDWPRT